MIINLGKLRDFSAFLSLAAVFTFALKTDTVLGKDGDKSLLPQCRVTVDSTPANVKITIDYRPIDEYPGFSQIDEGRCVVQLVPGDYVFGFSAPAYATVYAPLRIRQGDVSSHLSQSLERIKGLALLKSNPPGATVTVDGISLGRTPLLVSDFALGAWQATFALPGYRSQTLQFALKDRTPVLVEASLSSDAATLNIDANVPGARIRVNGVDRGVAPCTIERIPAGDVKIEAFAPGYGSYSQSLVAGEAQTLDIHVNLEPLPASLSIHSIPQGARVYLDNNYSGETPYTDATIAPGVHRIRVEKTGFDPMARTISLVRGGSAVEEFRLKANTGLLSVTSTPEGVAVYVDGVKLGETPPGERKDVSGVLEIPGVAEGTHSIEFMKPGFINKTEKCDVKRGEATLLRAELKRRFIPDYEVVTESGSHKGVLQSITPTAVRIETRPGIVSTYPLENITRHGPIK